VYLISKKFTFDAAHQLEGLPYEHKCGRLHGHTYTVEVVIGAHKLTEEGWVVDFGELLRSRSTSTTIATTGS
jgi:6-pyruvoyltetrahydropterin/6-carboxytetrahydropterin synthase